MKNSDHIKKIFVISNTHWDREFRFSFEKTRHNLIRMLDTTIDILESDKDYDSFTMDGHTIMIDDYLEQRPERKAQIKKLISGGRLIIGPYYTLAEEFSILQESLVRNLIYGRKTIDKYGGKSGTVAYTPSSWGQTGQLPQILAEFGLDKVMFYRGISHHESDAEWIWEAPDGTKAMASRFAIYARYNWYYQVHRPTYRNRIFEKDYIWGEFNESPFMICDQFTYENKSYDIVAPVANFDDTKLVESIENMVKTEGKHFTSDVFLAMNGHDISVAYPLESHVIKRANELLFGKYEIRHTNLEEFWEESLKTIDKSKLKVLKGERRAYLKEGMWTFLFPSTISARTYLKQKDFSATNKLVYFAEPLSVLSRILKGDSNHGYLDRAWRYLLSNHTHDANGGCAPDAVCNDMEYRYRKVEDIGDIVVEDSMSHITKNLSPINFMKDDLLLVVFNTLSYNRDVVELLNIDIPRVEKASSIAILDANGEEIEFQDLQFSRSDIFIDSIWEVPTIMNSYNVKGYGRFTDIPAMGYKVFKVVVKKAPLMHNRTLITSINSMENAYLKVVINSNGTLDLHNKETGKDYKQLNFLTDEGECGNAWKHVSPIYDRKYNSLSSKANVSISRSGELSSEITSEYEFAVPKDYADGTKRSDELVNMPIKAIYTLDKEAKRLKVKMIINNIAKDHLLRVNFPTGINTEYTFTDTHFDTIKRKIKIPDSTGWAEKAGGAQPLLTFVSMTDDRDTFALMPKGIYEYEAFEDNNNNLSLTLIRACRIKLAVSEEKQTELSDIGIACQGENIFEYSIFAGNHEDREQIIGKMAIESDVPVRIAACGTGQGNLPSQMSFLNNRNSKVQITAFKNAEQGNGSIIRLVNTTNHTQETELEIGFEFSKAFLCSLNEETIEEIGNATNVNSLNTKIIRLSIESKKIVSIFLRY